MSIIFTLLYREAEHTAIFTPEFSNQKRTTTTSPHQSTFTELARGTERRITPPIIFLAAATTRVAFLSPCTTPALTALPRLSTHPAPPSLGPNHGVPCMYFETMVPVTGVYLF